MKKLLIYIHGLDGNIDEAKHFEPIFSEYDVIGFDYKSNYPWEANKEFGEFFDKYKLEYNSISIIAVSIGAFFTMAALSNKQIEKAFFISPIVDMEKLIMDMMFSENINEEELFEKKDIPVDNRTTLSWGYLTYVREHPITWSIPTFILYGEEDNLTNLSTISSFAKKISAPLTIMSKGEHWFHTEEEMNFLDNWLKKSM